MSFTPRTAVNPTEIAVLASHLAGLGEVDLDTSDHQRIDQLRALEELKASVAAAQARVTVAFARSQELSAAARAAAAPRAGEPGAGGFEAWQARRDAERSRPSIGAQVGLARRLSPNQGAKQVTLAKALVEELPCTLAALEAGVISGWRATIIARESSSLSTVDRGVLDRELTADPDQLGGWGDKELANRVRAIAYRLDAQTAVDRAARAAQDRRVSIRPKPDTMCSVASLLPVKDGVAIYSALEGAATLARAQGDPRSRSQVMADTLVERVTGAASVEAIPVEVQVVISDTALLGVDDTPAQVPGYGPVPAGWVRNLLRLNDRTGDPAAPAKEEARVWLRRLYANPDTGALTQLESTRRIFPTGLRRLITSRDGTCRTPWCDAPIRHIDHIQDHANGGKTSHSNGQGLCERCNYTKQTPGWTSEVLPTGRGAPHRVRVTTSTGHTYDSTAPPGLRGLAPPASRPDVRHSPLEACIEYALSA